MYLMNFLFDFDHSDSFFSASQAPPAGSVTPAELFNSKAWLKLNSGGVVPEPATPVGFNPEPGPWNVIGDMDTAGLLIPKNLVGAGAVDDSSIGVRIALDPTSASALPITLGAAGATLSLCVCFGSPTQRGQKQASPFGNARARPPRPVQSTFIFPPITSNQVDNAGNPVSWYFPLSVIDLRPAASRVHRYEFAVGIIVNAGGVTHHYSHDPEMDVST
jgi:hypothetical protein